MKKKKRKKINIAMFGGPCEGKSTTAAALFAYFKERGIDFDLITEESRKLRNEFGHCRSPFERFYFWHQQEREEKRSNAPYGFITDAPLFDIYIAAKRHAKEERDEMAIRELGRMCQAIMDRYDIIVMAKNPNEIPYHKDGSRKGSRKNALERHRLAYHYAMYYFPEKVVEVSGTVENRKKQILAVYNKLPKYC